MLNLYLCIFGPKNAPSFPFYAKYPKKSEQSLFMHFIAFHQAKFKKSQITDLGMTAKNDLRPKNY